MPELIGKPTADAPTGITEDGRTALKTLLRSTAWRDLVVPLAEYRTNGARRRLEQLNIEGFRSIQEVGFQQGRIAEIVGLMGFLESLASPAPAEAGEQEGNI